MRIPELLAPAGGPDALRAAVAAGADAVYVGLGAFNARAANAGFTLAELERGCILAHAHGAQVYVTLNVYLRDAELDDAVALAAHARAAGADAFIVADAGLALALRAAMPDIELHLSTQAGVQDASGACLAARAFGVERVTCARELSVSELAALCASGVAVEAFCHGAICICYSGACAFSALVRARSANRGDCTQPCRMGYVLQDAAGRALAGGSWEARRDARRVGAASASDAVPFEGDRLLCPRDYLSIRRLPELVRAGVAALKIEGRMKNPDYVFNTVRCYRAALDALAAGGPYDADALEAMLARSFNRGFTDGYLRGTSGVEMMSLERSIHQGLRVGTVARRLDGAVELALERVVDAGDTLEIRSTPGADALPDVPKRWPMVPCPASASAGERLVVRCKRKVEVGSAVHVVRSAGVLAEAARAVDAMRIEEGRLCGTRAAGDVEVSVASRRRSASSALACAPGAAACADGLRDRERGASPAAPVSASSGSVSSTRSGDAPPLLPAPTLAMHPHEAEVLLARGAEAAVSAWRLLEADAPAWDALLSRLTVVLDEVCREGDEPRTRELCSRAGAVVCRNFGQIDLARAAGAVWDAAAPISVWNARTVSWLRELGARRVWLPEELSVDEAREVAAAWRARAAGAAMHGDTLSLETGGGLVHPGREGAELMVTEHCLLTAEGPCACSGRAGRPRASREAPGATASVCVACPRRLASLRGERFLVGADGVRLPVLVDALGRSRIFRPRA